MDAGTSDGAGHSSTRRETADGAAGTNEPTLLDIETSLVNSHRDDKVVPPANDGEPPRPAGSLDAAGTGAPPHDILATIQPRKGRLVPLRTVAEEAACLKLVDAHVILVEAKQANRVIKLTDALRPPSQPSLQHLRRVVPYTSLPLSARSRIPAAAPTSLCILSSLTSHLSLQTLTQALALADVPHTAATARVPLNAPSTAAAAARWTAQHWPTIFGAHNPFGPQPAQWTVSTPSRSSASHWIALAHRLGAATAARNCGPASGALIVDPGRNAAIAGAGDARWVPLLPLADTVDSTASSSDATTARPSAGNALAHATMRALALLGRQRVARGRDPAGASSLPSGNAAPESAVFRDGPMTALEHRVQAQSPLPPGGYLATGLDVYATHEPCVMCAMALLHSRVERVVVARPMPGTGGLMVRRVRRGEGGEGGEQTLEQVGQDGVEEAEDGGESGDGDREKNEDEEDGELAGYGLWYRPDLNWRMMAWQWVDEDENDGDTAEDIFHA